jgi:anti-anti-sigma regulatory factor
VQSLIQHPNAVVEEHAPDLLVFRLRGEGDASTVDEVFALVQPLFEARAPVRVIIDASGFADLSMSARWRLAMRTKENRPLISRTFVFGLSDTMRFVGQVIVRASGRKNIEMVDTEEEAHARARATQPIPDPGPQP